MIDLRAFWGWFRRGMKNGLKMQLAISAVILIAVVGNCRSITSRLTGPHRDITITGVSVQPAQIGKPLVWSRAVCNKSDKPIDIAFSVHLLQETSTSGESEVALPGSYTAVIPPGCAPPVTLNAPLTSAITPGTWTLRMIAEYTPEGGLLSLVSGTSAPFQIEKAQ